MTSHSFPPRHRASLPIAFCAVLLSLSVGAGVSAAKEDAAAVRLLNAEMPGGTTIETATCPETIFATRQAVRKHPDQASAIMQCAIGSRVSPGDRRGRNDDKDVVMPCECLTRIVQAALESARPNKVHDLIEMAMAMQPQCAEEITGLLKKPRIDGKDGPRAAANDGDRNGYGRRGRGDISNTGGDPGTDFGDRLIGAPGSGRGDVNGAGGNPGTGFGDRLIGENPDPGYGGFPGGASAFGGFAGSPTFAGAPGLIGSTPGGASGLFPPVVLTPLTSVANP